MTILEALNRTFLLMRSDLGPGIDDQQLLDALRSTRVLLVADEAALATHSGQCAFITAATTMARSAHSIFLEAPETPLIGAQPPLQGEWLLQALHELGGDLLPGWRFEEKAPGSADVAIVFGSPPVPISAGLVLYANASDWGCRLGTGPAGEWGAREWPIGGLAAAAVVAGEAFKAAMRKLRSEAISPALFDEIYAPLESVDVAIAADGTPKVPDLGCFDLVSAGAIGNGALHALLRIPAVSGRCRIIDHDHSGLTNLNRNALLRRSRLDLPKVKDIASYSSGLKIEPAPHRFGDRKSPPIALGPTVLVGVDHIPSRWAVQEEHPQWLAIGGTEGYSVQLSWHMPGLACARCVHSADIDREGEIPTAAFVSYWAGLLVATALLRQRSGSPAPLEEQTAFLSALRPESWAVACSPVSKAENCPSCGAARRAA
jgi:hypothetical protein